MIKFSEFGYRFIIYKWWMSSRTTIIIEKSIFTERFDDFFRTVDVCIKVFRYSKTNKNLSENGEQNWWIFRSSEHPTFKVFTYSQKCKFVHSNDFPFKEDKTNFHLHQNIRLWYVLILIIHTVVEFLRLCHKLIRSR